jgi:hypothetical protein
LLTGINVFFIQVSLDPWRISFSGHQNAEQGLHGCQIPMGLGSSDHWGIVFQVAKYLLVAQWKQDSLDPSFS